MAHGLPPFQIRTETTTTIFPQEDPTRKFRLSPSFFPLSSTHTKTQNIIFPPLACQQPFHLSGERATGARLLAMIKDRKHHSP
ncbi:hypothetical protein VTJ04DRAFT_8736 [Mycothermus thermophilus]|uniref:uncharacterized protein n=1 Tax=Humicola insolens TaxID=85995 RepID=UPI0037421854